MNKPKLRLVELFNGISAQYRGIVNTRLFDCEMVGTSDIDKDVIVECAAIHHGLTHEMVENYKDYPSKEEMAQSLTDRRIGYNFEKEKQYDWFKLVKKKTGHDLEKYWLAAELTHNLGDVSLIEKFPACDVLTFSSPCTDFSIAGKQEGSLNTCNKCGHKFNPFDYDVEERYTCPVCGSDDITGTRSGLLKEVERLLINSIKAGEAPKYLLQENVDALVSKKFKPDFDAFCRRLENLNYNVYWKVLNAKECGVPQNRRRLFMIGIRKDIDNGTFTFPLPFDTGVRLKDILETNVDERYYINTDRASSLIKQLVDKGQLKGQRECCDSTINDPNTRDISNCITSRYDASIQNKKSIGLAVAEPNQDRIGGLWDGDIKHQAGSVWNTEGVAPTLDTAQGGGRQPHIVELENIKTIWKELKGTQYKVSNTGIVADTKNKSKVEPFVDDSKLVKIKLNINGSEKTIELSKLIDKLFPYNIEESSKPICVGNTTPSGKSQCNAVYSTDGVSQTLCAGTHGYATGNILVDENNETNNPNIIGIKQATKKGYIECEVPRVADFSFPNSEKRRGRVQGGGQIVPTLTAAEGGIRYIESIYRIRKLTVRECFKLMGFEFEDWDKCEAIGISNSAGYKAAGNSIVTNCISLLFEHLYKAQYDSTYICTDEEFVNFQKPQA